MRAYWCEDEATLEPIKDIAVTIRNIPFDQKGVKGKCVLTGRDADREVIFARSY